jgi:hypothetical protein
LAVSIVGVHLGAFSILFCLEASGIAKTFFSAAIAVSLFVSIRSQIFLRGRRVVRQLVWPCAGSIRIEDGVGEKHDVALAQDCVVHPWLMVLVLIDESKIRHTMILFPDSGDRDVLRRLRMRLLLDRKTA